LKNVNAVVDFASNPGSNINYIRKRLNIEYQLAMPIFLRVVFVDTSII